MYRCHPDVPDDPIIRQHSLALLRRIAWIMKVGPLNIMDHMRQSEGERQRTKFKEIYEAIVGEFEWLEEHRRDIAAQGRPINRFRNWLFTGGCNRCRATKKWPRWPGSSSRGAMCPKRRASDEDFA